MSSVIFRAAAPIIGAGGGGKDGNDAHVPSEDPNSLRSKQFARVLEGVAEGEIEGLVNGLRSVYLDDSPIQNPDGSFNFSGAALYTAVGTQSQPYIPGFPASENEVAVDIEVKSSVAGVQTLTDASLTAARVTLGFPQLTSLDPSIGDLHGTTVQIAIDLQSNGGGFAPVRVDTISGKCTSEYQRSYRVQLTGSAPWQIRVRKLTPDSTVSTLANRVLWRSYTEIIDSKLRYPNTALCGLQFDATQFRSIPRRSYDLKLLRVQIPVNYDPLTRVYTGPWDGTFKIAWTDNPAWCFYDLVLSTRYGLGEFIGADQLDKWALFQIAQYCDELVDDGFGGQEPRFTCNLYLQSQDQAYTVLGNFASIFRAILYWTAATLTAVSDMPADPAYQYNQANVIDGVFNYAGSSRRARHTVALIAWNDPTDLYRQKIEYVEDEDGIVRYGVVSTSLTAFGCASRGQAHRMGKWLLLTEQLETETVVFRTGLEGVQAEPGRIIQIHDPSAAGIRFGGRVHSATTSLVTVDQAPSIDVSNGVLLTCVLPDGSMETRSVPHSGTNAFVPTVPFSQAPLPQSIWTLEYDQLVTTLWRVVSVLEAESNIYEITALSHDPTKFAAAESGIKLQSPPTLYVPPQGQLLPPTALTFTQRGVTTPLGTERRLEIGWTAPAEPLGRVRGYTVEWQFQFGIVYRSPQVTDTLYQVPAQPGAYVVRVYALGSTGNLSPALSGNFVLPDTSPINGSTITGLELYGQDNDTQFSGPDAVFAWRYNAAASSYELGSEPHGADSGSLDPTFRDFEVKIYSATGLLLRVEHTTDPHWTYTLDENTRDNKAGPQRSFTVGVRVRDKFNGVSEEALLAVTNPAEDPPASQAAYGGQSLVNVVASINEQPDHKGIIVYISTAPGFDPTLGQGQIAYRGPDPSPTIAGLAPGTTYYLRIAVEDVFGPGSVGPELSADTTAGGDTPGEIIASINSVLSGTSATDKLIFASDAFAIVDPNDAAHFPLAVVQLPDGSWAAAIQADTVINGNLSVANLTTGNLPTNVTFSLGGGTVVLDGAGSIAVYKGLGIQQDFVLLTAGDIQFKKYITALGQYVNYKSLRRLEAGTANSGDVVQIPGYWETQPKIQVGPNVITLYDPGFAAQKQAIRCQALNIGETAPGSQQYQFTARAQLELAANSGSTIINAGIGDTAAANWTSDVYTTPANAIDINVHIKARSKRGNGASQFLRRRFRWGIDYKRHTDPSFTIGALSAFADIGDVIDTYVLANRSFTFPAGANTYDWRVYIEYSDKDGSVFGAISYQTSTENIAQVTQTKIASASTVNNNVSTDLVTINLAASVVNPTWEIYEIDWTYQWSYQIFEQTNTLALEDKVAQIRNGGLVLQQVTDLWASSALGAFNPTHTIGNIGSYAAVAGQAIAGAGLTYTPSLSAYAQTNNHQSGFNNNATTQASIKNPSAVIKRRTPQPNSTVEVNNTLVDFFDYDLAAAQVLASGSLNWMAVGT